MDVKEKVLKFINLNKNKIILFSSLFVIFCLISIIIFYNVNKLEEEEPSTEKTLSLEIDKVEDEKEAPTSSKIYVDIKGYVVNPGIYEVNDNSRVNDVISSAGGLLENANTEFINLSKKVFDEMVIIIYSNEEIIEFNKKDEVKEEKECICENTINDACIVNNSISENKESSLVNINTADIELLTTLPGIGEAKAKTIIDYRNEVGKFNTIEDLMEVSGIGESVYSKIKNFITTE